MHRFGKNKVVQAAKMVIFCVIFKDLQMQRIAI